MSRIAFGTTEFWPMTGGGAGRLNADLVAMLVAAGHDVQVVLVAGLDVTTDVGHIHVVHETDAAGWDIGFMAVSKALAEGLAAVHSVSPLDRIEIQDFDGLPFWTLTHRGDLGFSEVPITIRMHGPVDLQIEAVGVGSHDLEVAAQMERESFSMADVTIVPSDGMRTLVVDRYGLEPDRVLVGTPIVRRLPVVPRRSPQNPEFTVIGRLSEVKGSHDMVRASLEMLREFPEASVTFVGADGWSATANMPMREWLSAMAPAGMSERIRFVDHAADAELAEMIAASTAVVAPSRFESFNLAVHESRQAGAPVVLPEILAFSGLFPGGFGAEMYDGSVEGLTAGLIRLASDPEVADRLSGEPAPMLGDPMDPYVTLLPPVWHRRSQGGLATAALARVETVRFAKPTLSRHRLWLQTLIRRAPKPLTAAVNKVLPRRMRDLITNAGDWDWEREDQRKRIDDRWTAIRDRIGVGELGRIDSPLISIVIPCFNQGAFIDDALLSIFEQTMDDFDIVVVDDGSDDGVTPAILDSLGFERVTVVHQDNMGLPGARNRGIAAARGEYVVTLDADDLLAPEYLEKLVAVLTADDSIAFAHCWARIFGDYDAIWATRPFNRFQLLLSNSVVGCVMLRKTAWAAVGGYDESMLQGNEDWDLWIRLTEAGYGNSQVREPLFWYRKHGVSMSVETEARYESVLASLSERLPDVYTLDHMRSIKHLAYPLLCVLTDDESFDQPTEDLQIVSTDFGSIGTVINEVRSKFVVWWPLHAKADPDILEGLCSLLEDDDTLGAAESAGSPPIRVVRTWSLRDPIGPDTLQQTELDGIGGEPLRVGQFPDDSWRVRDEIDGVAVNRQRPEEAGSMPSWVGA